MKITDFNNVVNTQAEKCLSLLCSKGLEYAPGAATVPENADRLIEQPNGQIAFGYQIAPVFESKDRLAHFKKAAAIMSATPKAALLGMLSKHIVSVSDMCTDSRDYPIEKWDEKITDSINYLLILRAIVEEEQHG